MRSIAFVIACFLSINLLAAAEKKEVSFGRFLDAYYGFDFNQPTGDRQFTTGAVRHNEFSINLAHVDVRLEKEKVHGRLALQAGTSVYTNYAGESRYNPANRAQLADVMRHIQEAYGGYRLTDNLWIDAGVFFSHIGSEAFISKDNWNYTRSLGADFTPYYQAGVRLSYQLTSKWSAQLHLLNGWQNMIATNRDKALGMQLVFRANEDLSFTYNNFIGREQEFRFFNNLFMNAKFSKIFSIVLSSDVGFQKKAASSAYSSWFVETLLAQLRLSDTLALGGRLEYFNDADQVLVSTSTAHGFQTFGASVNLDWQPDSSFMLRNEIRTLFSRDLVFASRSGRVATNTLLVTSLSIAF